MKSSPSSSLDLSTLPEGLRSRGTPVAVHRPWRDVIAEAEARFVKRLFGEKWRNFGRSVRFQRTLLFSLGALAFLAALVIAWIYFYHPPQNEDPLFVLVAAGIFFAFSIALTAGGFFVRRPDGEVPARSKRAEPPKAGPDLYLVYRDGLAAVTGGSFEFLAWDEVEEVATVSGELEVKSRDGRQITVRDGFTQMGELREAIYKQVNQHLLPRVLNRLAQGKSVRFGPFTLRSGGLKYKDRKASWDAITSMKIVGHGGDVRLTIYTSGRMFAWCWCDVNKIPNWNTLYDALCRTAPEHLLTTSTRPRW